MDAAEMTRLQEFQQWLIEQGYSDSKAKEYSSLLCDVVISLESRLLSAPAAPGYARYLANKMLHQNILLEFSDKADAVCSVLEKYVAFSERNLHSNILPWSATDAWLTASEKAHSSSLKEKNRWECFSKNVNRAIQIMNRLEHILLDQPNLQFSDKLIECVQSQTEQADNYIQQKDNFSIAKSGAERRLYQKILDAFNARKSGANPYYIGQIPIDDVEYSLLIEYTRRKLPNQLTNASGLSNSPIIAVALVQIGIRFYDGSFWPHAERELKRKLPGPLQRFLNETFSKTVRNYGFHLMDDSQIVQSILFHCIVSNYYAKGLFELLFQFYTRDMGRNIALNTPERMQNFIGVLKRTEKSASGRELSDFSGVAVSGASKAYRLNKHTLTAIATYPEETGTLLRRYIEIIDRAFWYHEYPEDSTARLTKCLREWIDSSGILKEEYRLREKAGRARGATLHQGPYLSVDYRTQRFHVELPSQQFPAGFNAEWITWNLYGPNGPLGKCESTIYPVFCGYRSEEASLELPDRLVLEDLDIEMCAGGEILKTFRIPSMGARFFDENGDYVRHLHAGLLTGYTTSEECIRSSALLDDESLGYLHRWSFDFQDGDVVLLPLHKSCCIGDRYKEGLLPHACLEGVWCQKNGHKIPVYRSVPQALFLIDSDKAAGCSLYINERRYRLQDCQYESLETSSTNQQAAFLIDLRQFSEICNLSVNEVVLELPGASFARAPIGFALCERLDVKFEDAPYIFAENGTVVFPDDIFVAVSDKSECTKSPHENSFNFELGKQDGNLHFSISGSDLDLLVEIPTLQWSMDQEHWRLAPLDDVWYHDFPNIFYFKGPFPEIGFELLCDSETTQNGTENSILKVRRNLDKDCFICDFSRFRSWITRDKPCYPIFLLLGKKRYLFCNVYSKSILFPNTLELLGDFERQCLILNCKIIGTSTYCADILYKQTGQLLADKFPFDGKHLVIPTHIRNGEYEVIVYEAEDDDGFEAYHYELGRHTCSLIDKNNLEGKQVQLQFISRSYYGSYRLMLIAGYSVKDLSRISESVYEGTLAYGAESLCKVQLNFSDGEEINRFFLQFWEEEYQEYEVFIYDRLEKKLITDDSEQNGIPYSQRYRRFTSLFEDQDQFAGIWEDEM